MAEWRENVHLLESYKNVSIWYLQIFVVEFFVEKVLCLFFDSKRTCPKGYRPREILYPHGCQEGQEWYGWDFALIFGSLRRVDHRLESFYGCRERGDNTAEHTLYRILSNCQELGVHELLYSNFENRRNRGGKEGSHGDDRTLTEIPKRIFLVDSWKWRSINTNARKSYLRSLIRAFSDTHTHTYTPM